MATHDRTTDFTLEGAIRLFQDGLTSTLSAADGIALAEGWADKIEASGRDELLGIARLLRRLAGQLADDPIDDTAVGDLLKQIGSHTTQAAATAGDEKAELLKKLGGYLKGAGIAFTGGTRPDQIAGVSTRVGGTFGDPTLRGTSAAPDPTTATPPLQRTVRDDLRVIGSDETPGRTPYDPK